MQGLSVHLKRQNGRLLSQLVLTQELELERTQRSGYETVLETTVTHEETMEMIVPAQYTQETAAGNLAYLFCFCSQGRTSLACW